MAWCGTCKKKYRKIRDAGLCCGSLSPEDIDLKAKGLIEGKDHWHDPERPGRIR